MVDETASDGAPDFSHLEVLAVEGKRRWMDLPKLGAKARIEGVCSHPFANDAMQVSKLQLSAMRPLLEGELDADKARRLRNEDRKVYAKQVLTGWEGIVDAKGRELPFNERNALAFLNSLSPFRFWEVQKFFSNVENFEGAVNVEGLSGNSSAGSSGN